MNVRVSSAAGPPHFQKEVETIVRWIGVDCHVATTTVAVLNGDDAKARHRRFDNTEEAWAAFCRDEVDATTHLVVEASAGIWPVYDRLVSAGAAEVLVAHPLRTKAIAAARVKTDRVDARTLALLGRGGLIPTVWVPSPQERLLRSLVRRRVSLARAATAQKNQIHAVLRRQGLREPDDALWTAAGQHWLAQQALPVSEALIVTGARELLEQLDTQQQALEAQMATLVREGDPAFYDDIDRLLTVPGVGLLVAVATRARLGDVRRFRNGRMAAAYVGLTPRVHRSAETQRNGRITKEGDRALRWLLIQAAWATIRTRRGRFFRVFERLSARKGTKVAIVAVARRLLILLFNWLRTKTRFRGVRATTVRRKQQQLHGTPVLASSPRPEGRPGAPRTPKGRASRSHKQQEVAAGVR